MSNTTQHTHTWHVTEPGGLVAGTEGGTYICDPDGKIIARMRGTVREDNRELARLIAAAPELFTQLCLANDNIALLHDDKRNRNECAFGVDTCSCALATNWRSNHKAIQKAEGQETPCEPS